MVHSLPQPPREYLGSARFETEIAGARHPAGASLSAFYDPKGERLRA